MVEQESPVFNQAALAQHFTPHAPAGDDSQRLLLADGQRRVDIVGPQTVRLRSATVFALVDELTVKELTDLANRLKKRTVKEPEGTLFNDFWLALGESAWLSKQPALAKQYLEEARSATALAR